MLHHTAIRTANINRAIAFYEQLGFRVQERFTVGITLACWLEGMGGRLELMQVPEPYPPPDPFGNEHYVGYYHLSFDVTHLTSDLLDWLASLRSRFDLVAQSDPDQYQPLRVLLEPEQQMIGPQVYEVAFIADADGLPLELIRMMGCA